MWAVYALAGWAGASIVVAAGFSLLVTAAKARPPRVSLPEPSELPAAPATTRPAAAQPRLVSN